MIYNHNFVQMWILRWAKWPMGLLFSVLAKNSGVNVQTPWPQFSDQQMERKRKFINKTETRAKLTWNAVQVSSINMLYAGLFLPFCKLKLVF